MSLKFAHDDKSRLACCSLDATISVCQVIPPPATVVCVLQGHERGITGEHTRHIVHEIDYALKLQ